MDDGEESDEDEPRGEDLLVDCFTVESTVDTRNLVLAFFLLDLLGSGFGTEEVCDFTDDGLMSFATLLLEESGGFIHLIYKDVVFFLNLLNKLADGLVRSVRHDEDLNDEDKNWYNEVEEEELLGPESAITPLVDYAIDEENGTGGVECTCEECKDKSGVFGESIGKLEGRDEYEWSSKRKE